MYEHQEVDEKVEFSYSRESPHHSYRRRYQYWTRRFFRVEQKKKLFSRSPSFFILPEGRWLFFYFMFWPQKFPIDDIFLLTNFPARRFQFSPPPPERLHCVVVGVVVGWTPRKKFRSTSLRYVTIIIIIDIIIIR